jgi:hypothetical protein
MPNPSGSVFAPNGMIGMACIHTAVLCGCVTPLHDAAAATAAGALVCRRAEQIDAAVVLMAKHQRGAMKEFFVGSVTNYACHHCKQPVLVLHCD